MIDDNQTIDEMNKVTTDKILTEIEDINGWTPYEDNMSGTLEWTHPDSDIAIYATPNWTEDGMTPVAVVDINDGEYEHITDFTSPDMETYVKVMEMIISFYIN